MTPAADPFNQLWDAANGGDPQSQYELGMHYWEQADYGRCRRWFRRAAAAGNTAAQVQLGRQSLLGLGMTASVSDAVAQFRAAAEAGDADAQFELACLSYRGQGVNRDLDLAARQLQRAATAGHPGALGSYALLALELGQSALFELAAGAAVAARNERLDTALGGRIAARALEPGETLPQLDFPPPPKLDGQVLAAGVRVFPKLIRADECRYLIETARPYLMPSHTVHPQTGQAVRNELRTSHGWSFHPTQEDIAIMRVKERLAAQAGLPYDHAEPFAMLRYQNGQEYREHFDFIDPSSGEAGREIGTRGQRIMTVFSYLTTVREGGETEFPRLGVSVKPEQGKAVLFSNVGANGAVEPNSLHASRPVVDGEKWLATLWFRDRRFEL